MKERPETLSGETTKYSMCGSLYVTVNTDDKGKPYEVFCNCAKLNTCRSNIEALARTISKMLQMGYIEEAIGATEKIRCPHMERRKGKNSITKEKNMETIAWSCPDAIARELQKFMKGEKK